MFGLSDIATKLIGLAVVLAVIGGLFGWGKYEQASAERWKAEYDKAATANAGLADQVKGLTLDKATSDSKALTAEKALGQFQAKSDQTVAETQKEVTRVSTPQDDVCSPALAAAFGRVCPKPPDNNAAAKN